MITRKLTLLASLLTLACGPGLRIEVTSRVWTNADVAQERTATKGRRCEIVTDSATQWPTRVLGTDSSVLVNLPADLRPIQPPAVAGGDQWRGRDGTILVLRPNVEGGVGLEAASRGFAYMYGVEGCLFAWPTDPIINLGLVAQLRETAPGHMVLKEVAGYSADIYLPLAGGPTFAAVIYAPTAQRRAQVLAGLATMRLAGPRP